jgi:hypothetical protein
MPSFIRVPAALLLALGVVSAVSCGEADSNFSRGGGGSGNPDAQSGVEASPGGSSGGAATGGRSGGSGDGGNATGGSSSGGAVGTAGGDAAAGTPDGGDASTTDSSNGGAGGAGGRGGSGGAGGAGGAGARPGNDGGGACTNRKTYYADTDGDHYGNPASTREACTLPSGYAENADDCYDGNASAKPGQTGWFATDRGDGSYDYDCDKDETQHWTGRGSCSVGICAVVSEGWQGTAPPCGTEAQYITGCAGLAICLPTTTPRTQECH